MRAVVRKVFRQHPAAAERLEQADDRLHPRQPDDNQLVLRLKQRALGVQHRGDVDRAGAQLLLGQFIGAPGRRDRIRLQALLLGEVAHGDQRTLHVREA
jgi:hypothetical protein